MARQVLENGVILPAEYSDDWYDDMTSNLTKLDDVIGSDSEKLSSADVGAAALSNNYNDLDNLPTIPTVNDATLTIQKNGVDVQTFTANASSNVTCNITVPTSTSDLINDSNFVDTSNPAVSSGITSAKVTSYDSHVADTDIHVTTADKTKWNNGVSQSYVFRYSSTALVASSTNSNTLLDNTDNLKIGDKVIDSSGVLFSITAIDTANSTFTIGTALIDLALDANVVHTSGNETVGGNKEFTGTTTAHDVIPSATDTYNFGNSSYQWNNFYAKNYYYNGTAWGLDKVNVWSENNIFNKRADLVNITSVENTTFAFTALTNTIFFNTRGSSNFKSYGTFLFAGYSSGSEPDRYGQIQLLRSTDKSGDTGNGYIPDSSFKMWRVAPHYLLMDFMEAVRVTNDGTENSLKPITNNVTELGTSTNKWKTINGLNPSSLSLPSGNLNDIIDISSYLTYLDGSSANTYIAPANGWISITMRGCSGVQAYIASFWGHQVIRPAVGDVRFFMPILKDKTANIRIFGGTIDNARFIPCQGNV